MGLVMFDDTNLRLIPRGAQAVAGYVNGHYITYPSVVQMWPNAKHLSISVNRYGVADCLDIERGDAVNGDAPGWVHAAMRRGVYRPVLYTSLSNVTALLRVLAAGGIMRTQVRIWSAHYTGRPHICGPACGFGLRHPVDATQWTDVANHESLDETLCADNFFAASPHPHDLGPDEPHIYLRDKDGQERWEAFSAINVTRRLAQVAARQFAEVDFVRVPKKSPT